MSTGTTDDEPKIYSRTEMTRAVARRLSQAKSEPSGLALVVADLVERVRVLEERIAEMERCGTRAPAPMPSL